MTKHDLPAFRRSPAPFLRQFGAATLPDAAEEHSAVRGSTTKVLSFSPVAPYESIPHAGGRHVMAVYNSLERQDVNLVVVCPQNGANVTATHEAGHPCKLHIAAAPHFKSAMIRSAASRAITVLEHAILPIDKFIADPQLLLEIVANRRMRRLIRSANLIDLQWQRSGLLIPIIRIVNRDIKIVITLHDLDSQSWGRRHQLSRDWKRLPFRLATLASMSYERLLGRMADTVVVLNDKDRRLLANLGLDENKIELLDPTFDMARALAYQHPVENRVICVAYLARAENSEGIEWLLSEVWPHVLNSVPSASLRIVEGGINDRLSKLIDESRNVSAVGYVDDLHAEYGAAEVAIVPLQRGAGVKFKAIEALLAGLPTVATSVGSEGIGGDEVFWGVEDTPGRFAQRIVDALVDKSSQLFARQVASSLAEKYSLARFDARIRAIYVDADDMSRTREMRIG